MFLAFLGKKKKKRKKYHDIRLCEGGNAGDTEWGRGLIFLLSTEML